MNNADKHTAHWSNTDVQKYLNGELSAREMHDLEQQALDDPFLADALEGLQTQPVETLQQDLAGLRDRLDTRIRPKPGGAIPWRAIRVAAAVILLVGLGFTAFYTLSDHKQPSGIAKAKAPAPPAATNQPAASPPAAADHSPAIPPAAAKSTASAAATHKAVIDTRPVTPSTAEAKIAPPAAEANLLTVESHVPADSLAYTTNVHKDSVTFKTSDFGYLSRSRVESARPAVTVGADPHLVAVTGRVLDFNNRPVAGASLVYRGKGTLTEAVTDAKGQFNLYVPLKDSTRRLTVAMPGYEETQYAFNTSEQRGNTIYLRQNQPELNEVVVSGIGAERKEYMAEPPSDAPEKLDSFWLDAAPVMGRIAYLDYLASAGKNIPVDSTIHGIESISFRVDKKGVLTEFRIERSLSPAHDAGVIKMITEGPPWKMLHGRTARPLVIVSF